MKEVSCEDPDRPEMQKRAVSFPAYGAGGPPTSLAQLILDILLTSVSFVHSLSLSLSPSPPLLPSSLSPPSHNVALAGLELTENSLPVLPSAERRLTPPRLAFVCRFSLVDGF